MENGLWWWGTGVDAGLRKQKMMMAWTRVVSVNGQTGVVFWRRVEALPLKLDSFP